MNTILTEKEYLLSSFRTHFRGYEKKRIAIYGIGNNTRYILENFPEFTIIGLMDEMRTGDIIFGKQVISLKEAIASNVEAIIIIARASNIRIIHRRISAFCQKYSIPVLDINGNFLTSENPMKKPIDKYSDVNEAFLQKKIDAADVISFDIFDTLIMRRCLYPRDVFYIIGDEFAKARINAETTLYSQGKHPNIYDIYNLMGDAYSPQKELEVEVDLLIRRDRMVAMLDYAVSIGKEIWFTSDMYLPKEILASLLERLGIHVVTDRILVSCDLKYSKNDGLFSILRSKVGNERILHIGDNYEADIIGAARYGVDDSFHIESAVAMLGDGYGDELLRYDATLANRIIIGEFIARQLNDPFLFSKTDGKFLVTSHQEMAYSFIAPLVWCFFGWMVGRAQELDVEEVLLTSRDCFLIELIYKELKHKIKLPAMRYFYTSRAVAVLAGLENAEDILHAAQLAYAGKLEKMLQYRFHLNPDEISERKTDENDDEYILRHSGYILKNAAEARRRYLDYIERLKIRSGMRIGFCDFISAGTCQKALSGIVDFELLGLYFASTNLSAEYKPWIKIEGMFGMLNAFKAGWHLLDNQFFLENVLTSHEPTLCGFDNLGNPLFSKELRSNSTLDRLSDMHAAVIKYIFETRIQLEDVKTVELAVIDTIVNFLKNDYSIITMDYFHEEELLDEFCNRKFAFQN